MEEILVQGNIIEDLKRLGINATRTYGDENTSYQVYEVSDEDFKKLSDEPDTAGTWKNGGWRWATGSNLSKPDTFVKVNQNMLFGWIDEESYEPYVYRNLLTYLEEVGCTSFKNVCAVTKDLATYNAITLGELFQSYQG
ncbi:hypothetical protein [Bacillus thuringiensis]|uniref:hypothetical protein n=1 Tax=Bacillus thuringiensis TaxID=1428 RepID=UPI000BF5B6F1|nr:hypothetical protein [Bacillus thuringiensis]PFF63359.1 hypothetical protein CN334_19390 [Bacillus thuringiensis]